MKKTVICNYWIQGTCKFMKNSEKCKFAHGTDKLKTITIECKYGSFCHDVDCIFFHGFISTTRKMVYEFPLIIEKSKKSKKKINKNNFIKNDNSEESKYLEECNPIEKDIPINTEYSDLNCIIKKLEIENKRLKNEIENLKNSHTKDGIVECKKINNKKMDILYNKYINIYNIFNKFDNNYKIIKDEIKQYTNDNNIYKVKSRATKIYNFYNNLKNGIINEYLPITKIIKMSF